jgi:hypothetical protein
MRGDGTVMTDLFVRYADAVETAIEWRQLLNATRRRECARASIDPPVGIEGAVAAKR